MTAAPLVYTGNVSPRERTSVWREWIWKRSGGMKSHRYGDTDFDAHMASARAGEGILTRLEANHHRVKCTAGVARAITGIALS